MAPRELFVCKVETSQQVPALLADGGVGRCVLDPVARGLVNGACLCLFCVHWPGVEGTPLAVEEREGEGEGAPAWSSGPAKPPLGSVLTTGSLSLTSSSAASLSRWLPAPFCMTSVTSEEIFQSSFGFVVEGPCTC